MSLQVVEKDIIPQCLCLKCNDYSIYELKERHHRDFLGWLEKFGNRKRNPYDKGLITYLCPKCHHIIHIVMKKVLDHLIYDANPHVLHMDTLEKWICKDGIVKEDLYFLLENQIGILDFSSGLVRLTALGWLRSQAIFDYNIENDYNKEQKLVSSKK